MNKHLTAFGIKFIGTFVILYLVLGFTYGMSFTEVLLLSAVLGTVAYLIGDLFILSRTNNMVGSIADFILSWVVIYFFVSWSETTASPFIASLLATVCVSLFEVMFHRYVESKVFPDGGNQAKERNMTYQTEIAEELDLDEIRRKSKRNQ